MTLCEKVTHSLNHGRYHEVLVDLHKEFGPLVRENFGTKTIVHVFDLDDIKTVGKCWIFSSLRKQGVVGFL